MPPNRVESIIFVVLLGVIGFMLPQHLGGVQRLQAVFIAADEQLILNNECEPIAAGDFSAVAAKHPSSCQFVIRARDLYEGRSLPEARKAFESDRHEDQLKFAALGLLLGLLFLSAYQVVRKLLLRVGIVRPRGSN